LVLDCAGLTVTGRKQLRYLYGQRIPASQG
jgi:hypothetical protein